MFIDNSLINRILEQAEKSDRMRANICLHETIADNVQKMVNVLIPGTKVPIHRHHNTNETLILLKGKATIMYYDDTINENRRITLMQDNIICIDIPKDKWHGIEVDEPVVLFEIKEGPYRPLQEDEIYIEK